MIMALGTAGGQSLPDLHGGVDSIDHGSHTKLLVLCATLVVGHGVSMECSGEATGFIRSIDQVSRQLQDGELIEGKIAVKSLDHPVTPGPDVSHSILLVTLGICITSQIEPCTGPTFAE